MRIYTIKPLSLSRSSLKNAPTLFETSLLNIVTTLSNCRLICSETNVFNRRAISTKLKRESAGKATVSFSPERGTISILKVEEEDK